MKKFFNTAGPCLPEEHHMLPAQERIGGLSGLIERRQYFVIHAARQTGKTTLLLDLVKELNASGKYHGMYCSLESVQGIHEPERGIPAILDVLRAEAAYGKQTFPEVRGRQGFNTLLRTSLTDFCESLGNPLVILFDEADCLSDGTLIAFLRQLREGFVNRGRIPFVHSIALVGMRNIRDYKVLIRDEHQSLGSASPFNIVSEAFTLRNFTGEEVAQLCAQHTRATGQAFPPEVTDRIYHHTRGQPWLVNAVAKEIVEKILGSDFSQAIRPEHVEQATERIIRRRDTHIDSLMERLREERVRKVVEPVITGGPRGYDSLDDDYRYVLDLGLLREFPEGLLPANPVYAEVLIRTLSLRSQMQMNDMGHPPTMPAYLSADGRIDMGRLLGDFQDFWRRNSEIWAETYDYKEAAPHLILQAFLQRVVNQGGQISRDPAAGTGRLDLCVHHQGFDHPVELKLRYGDHTYKEGQDQIARYMDKFGCSEGWLIVFDRRKTVLWEEKIFWKTIDFRGKTIHIVGC